jgi:HNH endonuclease
MKCGFFLLILSKQNKQERPMSIEQNNDVIGDWSYWVEIFVRDRLQCVYCGLDGKRDLQSFWQIVHSLDHLIPRSLYGSNTPDNLVTCCWPCNKRKSDFDPRDRKPDGTPDESTSRERMIENVKARWREDRAYWEGARNAFIERLATIPEMPKELVVSVTTSLSRADDG